MHVFSISMEKGNGQMEAELHVTILFQYKFYGDWQF
jgi:hypothetical protein